MHRLNYAFLFRQYGFVIANVKVRLNRAKTMLRNKIEKTYTADERFEFKLNYCDALAERVIRRINEL